jgi:ubiquinone/menaquinone biosynthesis C-methylase UbiE
VACGSGNLTIPAARTRAYVTGLDLVPSLLAAAMAWARREHVSVALDEGNAEELPYADEQVDVVMSMFGVMFAARLATELAAHWTAQQRANGAMTELDAEYLEVVAIKR